jgi:hypothetical protein
VRTLDDTTYADLRGFNYQPGHASHGIEIWGTDFAPDLVRKELWIGTHHFPGIDAIRLWLSHDAYLRYPERVSERLGTVLDAGEDYGVKFLVTLFNGWHSYPDLGGLHPFSLSEWEKGPEYEQVFEPYVADTVGEYADHDAVLAWDLCNEPSFSDEDRTSPPGEREEPTLTYRFLERVHEQVRGLEPAAPTTVGTVASPATVERYEPLSDVLSTHPYYSYDLPDGPDDPAEFESAVDDLVAVANRAGKPLLATETGWGALDDARRAETLDVELAALAERGVGFTAHLLHHTPVADGHRPARGPVWTPGHMAFVERSGDLRPGHGVFNEY